MKRFGKTRKKPLCASIIKAFHRGELTHSQKQTYREKR